MNGVANFLGPSRRKLSDGGTLTLDSGEFVRNFLSGEEVPGRFQGLENLLVAGKLGGLVR